MNEYPKEDSLVLKCLYISFDEIDYRNNKQLSKRLGISLINPSNCQFIKR